MQTAINQHETPPAIHALGLAALREKDFELAAANFAQAIGLAGPVPEYCQSLAKALYACGKFRQAAVCYEQAIAGDPDNAGFHYDLGVLLCQLGDLEESEAAYRRALQVNPRFPEALNNLGNLLRRSNRSVEAVTCFRRALRCRPDYSDAQYNLGLALQSLDRLEDAESCYRNVLEVAPVHHAASNNYGNVLLGQGRIREALPRYKHAVRLAPRNREYRINTGMAQLLDGDYLEGWRNYDSRAMPVVAGSRLWKGEPLGGSTILLVSEQGLGDTIQFIRYASQIGDHKGGNRGGRVQALCPEPLVELLRTARGLEEVTPAGQSPPPCDWYAPLLHLPAVFGTSIETIPAEVPYLSADPERVRAWGMSLKIPETHLRVGIAWRGGPDHWNDRNRSMDPSFLSVLKGVPSTTFVSLQKGCREGCKGLQFVPLERDLQDFADTAALMVHLDLVISVDTSVAHLAGALGRPTWLLLPFAPDWRWMRDRSDSPWYPGMRLFRQERRGKWLPVLRKVRDALLQLSP